MNIYCFVFFAFFFLLFLVKGNLARFQDLWEGCIAAAASRSGFKVVAVSFPDLGENTGLAVAAMGALMDNNGAGEREGEGEGEAGTAERAAEVNTFGGGEAVGRVLNVWQVRVRGIEYTEDGHTKATHHSHATSRHVRPLASLWRSVRIPRRGL